MAVAIDVLVHAASGHRGGRRRVPVGIAVPGFLDPARDRIVRLSNLPALNGVELAREIELRVPRARGCLDTDTNAGAIAEARQGAGKGFDRVLYVTLGTGLGAAFIVGGRPVRVSRHTVGQIAHIPIDPAGPPCYCGERGCAETLLSGRGILWRARRAGLRGRWTAEELWRLARGLDPPSKPPAPVRPGTRAVARRVWNETGELLGRLLRILAGLFSPDAIVIGGGIAGASDLLLPPARSHLGRHLLPRLRPPIVLRQGRLGLHAGAIGAAILAREGL